MTYATIHCCLQDYPVQLMCRCPRVSRSGYYDWALRAPSRRQRANSRLVDRMNETPTDSNGVIGAPRMGETLRYDGETVSRNRVARLMAIDGTHGVPQRRRWRRKSSRDRPNHVRNHLERDFAALEPNIKWVTDITYVRTAEAWLHVCVVIDLYSKRMVGGSMSRTQNRELVIKAVMMALYQCGCANDMAAEAFFGMLEGERVHGRRYQTVAEAGADVFDYIERFCNPRVDRRLESEDRRYQLAFS